MYVVGCLRGVTSGIGGEGDKLPSRAYLAKRCRSLTKKVALHYILLEVSPAFIKGASLVVRRGSHIDCTIGCDLWIFCATYVWTPYRRFFRNLLK